MTPILEKEFQYYLSHQDSLVEKYIGRHIIIVGEEVIGAYDSQLEAFEFALKEGHKPGTFLIQHVLPGNRSHTNTFHSRVIL